MARHHYRDDDERFMELAARVVGRAPRNMVEDAMTNAQNEEGEDRSTATTDECPPEGDGWGGDKRSEIRYCPYCGSSATLDSHGVYAICDETGHDFLLE